MCAPEVDCPPPACSLPGPSSPKLPPLLQASWQVLPRLESWSTSHWPSATGLATPGAPEPPATTTRLAGQPTHAWPTAIGTSTWSLGGSRCVCCLRCIPPPALWQAASCVHPPAFITSQLLLLPTSPLSPGLPWRRPRRPPWARLQCDRHHHRPQLRPGRRLCCLRAALPGQLLSRCCAPGARLLGLRPQQPDCGQRCCQQHKHQRQRHPKFRSAG